MSVKNYVRLFLLVLLVAAGPIPVLAHEPDQCGSVEPIRPGDSVTDAVSDVPAAHIDITKVETSLSGERLTVVFHLQDLPETLTFNRIEYGKGTKEYEWEVAIDVDNDRSTGPGGFDMLLTAYHIAFLSHTLAEAEERAPIENLLDADLSAPIEDMLESSVWEINPDGSTTTTTETHITETHSDGSTRTIGAVGPAVSAEADTITITGVIPGITFESRLAFEAYDVEFAGNADQIACHDTYSKYLGAWGCDSGKALIKPGQTATDAIESGTPSYIDVSKVSTALSGETLTVVFHLRDIPEKLTFNRTDVSASSMEYSWGVSIDVDNDRQTGDNGFEYLLSAYHIAWPAHAGDNTEAPIEEVAEASVWEMLPGEGIRSLRDATLEVSEETNTMILSGRISGITPDSRLSFLTHGHLGEFDGVGCQDPPGNLTPSSQCDSDEAVTPGESVSDEVSEFLAAHLDVTEISTSLSGETLTVVFHFRDVPEALTFNRSGVLGNAMEYSWEVSIDVDADQDTGLHGFEYILSSIHVSHGGSSGRDRSAAITTDILQTNTWVLNPTGSANREIDFLEWARIEVSAEEDTVTLSGEIPGITAESQLAFGVYDYLGGAEEVGCLTPFGLGRPASFQGSSDGSEVTPGQSVSEDVSHEQVEHIDFRDVTTTLDGETLTVTFLLRDVPEKFTFDRTGVPENALEYSWEVFIDIDSDPETGAGGFEYTLSAGYFVPPLARDSNTVARLTQPGFVEARIWGLDQEGNRVLAEGSIEVSSEENTITLSGKIPGITEESTLKFKSYDYFGGSLETSSHGSLITGLGADSCQSDDAVIRPGQRVIDAVSDTLPAHVDFTEVSTTLTGEETLAVVFQLRDVPETLEFFRKNVPRNALEYNWEVSIDVDNDRETGLLGADYSLSASHFAFSSSSGEAVLLPIGEAVQPNSWQLDERGGLYLSDISLEVSPEENTVTLIGDVPGITSQSRLVFESYDYLNGSEKIACQVTSIAGGTE